MKNTVDQNSRNTVVANAIVGGIRRALQSVQGVKCTNGVSERALLSYALRAGMLEPEEINLCRGVYGFF